MNLGDAAALALVGWYLLSATPARTPDSTFPGSGIQGIVGCPPSFGNAPAGDITWPCGRVVNSKTGKDIGEITCHVMTNGFSVPLLPGKYIVHLQNGNETRTESVVVEEHKWTDVEPWLKACRPLPGPVA
jgi:hypothetical protein